MRAHVFDMDGTLLHGTAAPVLLAAALGRPGALEALEARFASGAITAVRFAHELHAMWGVVSPDYFAEQFLDYGFDAVFASRFPRDADTPLDEAGILNPRDKPRLAARFCAEHGLALEQAVAYGDSMSDVHLFEAVGVRISVNGDHHLAERADIAVEGTDLLPAYRAARGLCDAAG